FTQSTGGGILSIELVAHQTLQRFGLLLVRDEGLHDLEDSTAFAHAHSADAFGCCAKGFEFTTAPVRPFKIDVTRSNDWNEHRTANEIGVDDRSQNVVAVNRSSIPENSRLASEQLLQPYSQAVLKILNPSELACNQWLIV